MAQQILGVKTNEREEAVGVIWTSVLPKMRAWLEASGKHKQKIKLEFIFKDENPTIFSLISEISQHDEFNLGREVAADPSRRAGLEGMPLSGRVEHAKRAIEPVLFDALAFKRSPHRSLKVRVAIGSGVCRWVEKIYGVEASPFSD